MKKENKSKQSFITAKEFKSNYMPPETTTLSKWFLIVALLIVWGNKGINYIYSYLENRQN